MADFTAALGVDDQSIVGVYQIGLVPHGFIYDGSNFNKVDFPSVATSGTVALGISNHRVVGYYIEGTGNPHGFLFDGDNYTSLDVPAALGSNTVANDIDGNVIVGSFDSPRGQRGFITVIPEPSTGLLAILALPLTLRLLGKRP